MDERKKKFVSVPDLAAELDISKNLLYEAVNRKQIAAVKFGKAVRIPVDEADRIVREGIPQD